MSEDLQRQAGGGVIRKGGIESRLDVVTMDYIAPPKSDMKRSRSTPAAVRPLCLLYPVALYLKTPSRFGTNATVSLQLGIPSMRCRIIWTR